MSSSSLLPLDNFITIDSHWHPFDQSQLCIDQLDSASSSCRSPTPKRPPSPELGSPTRKKPKHDPLGPSPFLPESELQDLLGGRQTENFGNHQLSSSPSEPASTKSRSPATRQTRLSQLQAQEALSLSPSLLDHKLPQPGSLVHPHDDAPEDSLISSSSQPDSTSSPCGPSSPSILGRHPRTTSQESPPTAPLRPRHAPARTPARSRRRSCGQHQLLPKTSSLEYPSLSDCKDILEVMPSKVVQQIDPASEVDSTSVPDCSPYKQQTRIADLEKCDGLGELSDDLGLGPSGSLFSRQTSAVDVRPPSKLSQRFSNMSKKATTATSTTKYQPETSTSSVFRPPKRNRHKANEQARIMALTRRHTAINEARVCVLKIEVQHMGRVRPPSPGPTSRRYMGASASLSAKRGASGSEGDGEKEDEVMALGGKANCDSNDSENRAEGPSETRKVRWGNPLVVDSDDDEEDFDDVVQEQQQLEQEQEEEVVLEKLQEETDEGKRGEEILKEVKNEDPKRKSILVNKVKLDEDGNVVGKKIDSKISPEFIVVKRRLWKR